MRTVLVHDVRTGPQVIVIDEFPYLVEQDPSLECEAAEGLGQVPQRSPGTPRADRFGDIHDVGAHGVRAAPPREAGPWRWSRSPSGGIGI